MQIQIEKITAILKNAVFNATRDFTVKTVGTKLKRNQTFASPESRNCPFPPLPCGGCVGALMASKLSPLTISADGYFTAMQDVHVRFISI